MARCVHVSKMVKRIYKSLGFRHTGLREEEIARLVASTCAYAGERVKLKKIQTLPVLENKHT